MKYALAYISIGIVVVVLCEGLNAQNASQVTGPMPTHALPDFSVPPRAAAPSLDINVPPPPESPIVRRRLGQSRSRADDAPLPRVFRRPGEGSPLAGQWSITNPHGTMTHAWERERWEDGYSAHREHTWIAPDGTPLQSQQFDNTLTDPNSYQRQRTITLRDGRTIQHRFTQVGEGETFQTEHSFSGPNGQTWTRQHTWSLGSDDSPAPPNVPAPDAPMAFNPLGGIVQGSANPGRPADSLPAKRLGQSRSQRGLDNSAPPVPRPSGFTLGASGWRGWSTVGQGPSSRLSRPPEPTPSLGKRLRAESADAEHPGRLRFSTLPRLHGKR